MVRLAALRPGADEVPLPLTRGGVLDGLRFLAAFCMVIYHFSFCSPTPLARLHPVFARGYLATDFFLVVSGYVLGRIYGARVAGSDLGTLSFLTRRAKRVVPAHVIMVGAFVGLVALCALVGVAPQHPEFVSWSDLPGELFLVQAFGVPGGIGWNSPSWSLSALLGCYALFPIVWRAQSRVPNPAAVVGLAIAVLVGSDVVSRLLLHVPIYEFPSSLGIVRAVPLFLLGASLARVSDGTFIPPRLAAALTVAAAALLVAVQFVGQFDLASIALIAVMVVGAGALPAKRPSRLMEKAALVSFALFITNEFVRTLYAGALHVVTRGRVVDPTLQWAAWWTAIVAAVGFAVAFHYLVDMPTQGWIRALTVVRRSEARESPKLATA